MEYGPILLGLLGGGTVFLALISYNEWKRERSPQIRQVSETKKTKKEHVAAKSKRLAA